ncbi:MAG: LAGLIDADG family homing endonuclease [Candidatus ainarchaeum sp.]|nr:LAGLIDADG family homing endonuclease [Candidatus ainarchaeum sp.]
MNKKEMEAELIGAIIGGGYISTACKKYIIGFTGHPEDDLGYYIYLSKLVEIVLGKNAFSKERLRGLRMKIYSKPICNYLVNSVGLISGSTKSFSVKISKQFFKEWSLLRYVIRGFADTGGSVFFSKKPGVKKYPSIELTTCSINLAKQLRKVLLNKGFRVTKLRSYSSKLSKRPCYKVCLYGIKNLQKWVKEIGFLNPTKKAKAENLLRDA